MGKWPAAKPDGSAPQIGSTRIFNDGDTSHQGANRYEDNVAMRKPMMMR